MDVGTESADSGFRAKIFRRACGRPSRFRRLCFLVSVFGFLYPSFRFAVPM